MFDDIGKWANDNTGILAIILFIIGILIAWIIGLIKFISNRFFKKEGSPAIQIEGNLKSEGPLVIGNNNKIIIDTSKSSLEQQVVEMESSFGQGRASIQEGKDVYESSTERVPVRADEREHKKAMDIFSGGQSPENKTNLRTLYYTTTDKVTQLQVVLVLVEWFMPQEDNLEDLISLCDEGIALAEEINAKQEKAALLAYKGYLISIQFSDLDFETASRDLIANKLDVSLMTKEEREKIINKLNYLYELSGSCFKEAEKLAKEINSYKALGFVYRQIGIAAGHRFIHLSHFGASSAEQEKQLSKRAFRLSKNIYASTNDELEIAHTSFNFANQLRNFGEKEEAIGLLEDVKSIASKYNDQDLIHAANLLSNKINSGNIPNNTQAT